MWVNVTWEQQKQVVKTPLTCVFSVAYIHIHLFNTEKA